MIEIWKDIPGYEGLYQVSNLGKVKSLSFRNNQTTIKREKILSVLKKDNKYLYISLSKNGKRKNKYIHRLVAEAFIDNKNKYPFVNHIDYDVTNNKVDNLEWCTQEYNVKYSIKNMYKRRKRTHSNTGERYISYRKENDTYRITINKIEYPSCKTLEEAIRKRDEILGGV